MISFYELQQIINQSDFEHYCGQKKLLLYRLRNEKEFNNIGFLARPVSLGFCLEFIYWSDEKNLVRLRTTSPILKIDMKDDNITLSTLNSTYTLESYTPVNFSKKV